MGPHVLGNCSTIVGSNGATRDIFAQIVVGLSVDHGEKIAMMIEMSDIRANCTASSLGAKKGDGRPFCRTKGALNTKPHVICYRWGRQAFSFFAISVQVRNCIGAAVMLRRL